MRRFPWAAYMEMGLGILRLPPQHFWAATPREIRAAFPQGSGQSPARADIEALMQRFPDEG